MHNAITWHLLPLCMFLVCDNYELMTILTPTYFRKSKSTSTLPSGAVHRPSWKMPKSVLRLPRASWTNFVPNTVAKWPQHAPWYLLIMETIKFLRNLALKCQMSHILSLIVPVHPHRLHFQESIPCLFIICRAILALLVHLLPELLPKA